MYTKDMYIKCGDFYQRYAYKYPIKVGASIKQPPREDKNGRKERNPEIDTENADRSARRARAQIRRKIYGQYKNELYKSETIKFLTLTFSEEITNLEECIYEWKKFKQKLERRTPKQFEYITVPEIQTKRAQKYGKKVWHLHSLLFNVPYIDAADLQNVWGNGAINLKKVNRAMSTGNYMTKYITKSYNTPEFKNKRRYYSSLGMPVERIYQPNQVELIDTILRNTPTETISRTHTPFLDAQGRSVLQVLDKTEVIVCQK